MPKYRILALDGGGIRGVLTAALLERLETESGIDLTRQVDLYAGASTGGILALVLAAGLTPRACKDFYANAGKKIFARSWLTPLRNLFVAKYSNHELRRQLETIFARQGVSTLGDLRKKVLIPSFDLHSHSCGPAGQQRGKGENQRHGVDTWKPKFFDNFKGGELESDIVEVALATSAAPIYFPSAGRYVDGGIIANNPSMCALAQALQFKAELGIELEDIELLSIGSGFNPKYLKGENLNWGWPRWVNFKTFTPAVSTKVKALAAVRARPQASSTLVVDLFKEGVNDIAHYQCRQILAERFHRLSPLLQLAGQIKRINLDEADEIPALLDIAQEAELKDDDPGNPVCTICWLKEHFGYSLER